MPLPRTLRRHLSPTHQHLLVESPLHHRCCVVPLPLSSCTCPYLFIPKKFILKKSGVEFASFPISASLVRFSEKVDVNSNVEELCRGMRGKAICLDPVSCAFAQPHNLLSISSIPQTFLFSPMGSSPLCSWCL